MVKVLGLQMMMVGKLILEIVRLLIVQFNHVIYIMVQEDVQLIHCLAHTMGTFQ